MNQIKVMLQKKDMMILMEKPLIFKEMLESLLMIKIKIMMILLQLFQ